MAKANKNKQPIGIFDSGIGGLTVANAVCRALPNEEIIYFGDTFHLPYGEKSADAIRYYCIKIVKFLLEQNCKMIIIACNSASSAAYHTVLDFYKGETIFVDVVNPLVEAVAAKEYEKVGVIATKATIGTGVYEKKLLAEQSDLEVVSLATPLLVPMIEEGFCNNDISESIIKQYLSNKNFDGIQAMLLACTHYPLIKKNIENFYDGKVNVYDSTDVVTTVVKNKLAKKNLLNDKKENAHRFYVSDFTQSFEETTRIFYEQEIDLVEKKIWG